jgi:hypothetical protein
MSMRLVTAALILLLVSPADVVGSEQTLGSFSGEKILQLRVEGVNIPESEIRELLPLNEGEPLNPELVAMGVSLSFTRSWHEAGSRGSNSRGICPSGIQNCCVTRI